MLADLTRDLLHGIRVLRKEPSFALIAVFTLALGISAAATVFSLLDGLLLRPLPVDRPGELVALATSDHHTEFPHGLSYRDYLDLKSGRETFSDILLFSPVQGNFTSEGQPELTWGQIVTGNYFRALGVEAALGRTFFTEQDEAAGADPLLVLGNGFWKRRFGGDPGIVGRTVLLNGESFTVAGVMPSDFRGLEVMFSPDFWVPLSMLAEVSRLPRSVYEDRDAHRFRAWARLASAVSFEQAQAALNVRAEQLAREYPSTNRTVKFRLYPSWEARVEAGTGRIYVLAFGLLTAVAAMVLLIACANVANLLLSRAAARRREMALRISLGAARGRLVRQLLAEGLILAAAAGMGAVVLAYGATKLLSQIRFSGVPLELTFPIDLRVLALTGAVALSAALLFAMAPALRASRPDLVPALKGEELAGFEGRVSLRSALAVAQVALSLILLVGAGLFLRTLHNVQTADLGLRSKDLLLASVNLRLQGYDQVKARLFHRDLLQRLRAIPGVSSATLAAPVPLDFFVDSTDVIIEGREAPPEKEKIGIMTSVVALDYFEVLGTRLLEGRGFTEQDNERSRRVAVVNETMAQHYWPGVSAVGKRFYIDRRDTEPVEVVGIAQAGKYRMYFEPPQDYVFLPLTQHESGGVTLAVQSRREAGDLLSDVRQAVAALDPNLPLFGVRSVEEYLRGRTFFGPRLLTSFLGAFGLVGLTLAAVGVYGVVAYSVSRRTREIGIRIALGAEPAQVLLGVLREGITLAAIGIALGLAGAAALTRLVALMLYGVSPTDPWTFGGIALFLTLVALWASFVPARRAMRVDPQIALRYE